MNKLKALVKIQIKEFLNSTQSGLRISGFGLGRFKLKTAFLGKALILLVFVLLLIPVIETSTALHNLFAMTGYPELVITAMYMATTIFMFFLALPTVISVFFYAKDTKFLIALPLNADTILFSKLSVIYIILLAITSLVFAPALVIYGLETGLSFSLVISSLLAVLLAPLMPLAISSLLILPWMRVISNSKRRNLLTIFGNLVLLAMILIAQVTMSRLATNPANVQRLLLGEDALLHLLGSAFPPSIWLTKMVLGFWRETLLFIGLNMVFVFALRAMAKTFYNHSLLGFNQASLITTGDIYYQKRSKAFQLIKRHVLVIVKQPMFLLNTVLVTFLPLLLFAINYFTGDFDFFAISKSPVLAPYLVFIFAGIISIPAMMANLSATAITREGGSFWETMVLPLSVHDNVKYRIATTLLLNFAGSIVLGIIALFFLPLTVFEMLLAVCLCLALTLFLATIDIIVNIHRPYLNWSHPTAAIKNNLNVIISLAFRAGLGFVFYRLYLLWPNLTSLQYSGLLILLFSVFYLLAHFLVYGSYLDKFSKITV